MRSLWLRSAALVAVLFVSPWAAAEEGAEPNCDQTTGYVVSCKVFEPGQDRRLIVVVVPEGKETVVPVRIRLKTSDGMAELDSLSLNVPGEQGTKTVQIGHQIKVKVEAKSANQIRLDADVAYRHCDLSADLADRELVCSSGRYLGTVAFGKQAKVVLAADGKGAASHWIELTIKPVDEQARLQAEYSTCVYSVAGLVSPSKKHGYLKLDFDPLMRRIETQVSPETWSVAGGEGKMRPYARSASLVVTQTAAVHRELSEYLARILDDEEAIQEAILERQLSRSAGFETGSHFRAAEAETADLDQ